MAKQQKITLSSWLSVSLQRVSVFQFIFLIGYTLQVMLYDAAQVITPQVVLWRWLAMGGLLAITSIVWYLAHNQQNDVSAYKKLVFLLAAANIAFASFNVYTQRGMASRAVILYVLAIIISSILLSRAAIYTTAILSATAYAVTTVAYFTLNFNEGYRAELYGEVLFYGFTFIIMAGLLSTVVRFGGKSADS